MSQYRKKKLNKLKLITLDLNIEIKSEYKSF